MPGYKISVSKYSLDKKISTGSEFWPQFNSGFENKLIETDMLAQSIYDGYPITTWHKDHWRIGSNYICGQSIGLDFDSGDASSTIQALSKDKFISKYAAFVHTTISHTEEAPRSRVIFVLDEAIYQPNNYVLAASSLLWLFGTADRACRDAVRFWYGSKGCEFEYINQVLPLEIVKHLIKEYQETGLKEKRQSSKYIAPASQQEVSAALKLIPPWGINYDEWVQVLMGIHSQFGDDGYQLAESWADGKKGEIDHKWKSFHNNGNVTGAVTIATVFGIAKKFGWRKTDD
jgi:hypothetical protein